MCTHGFLLLAVSLEKKTASNVGVAPEHAGNPFSPQRQFQEDVAERLKREGEEHAQSVGFFLRRPDHVLRMLRYREILLIVAEVRGPMLHRAGPGWEAAELVNANRHGQRTYGCEAGHNAEDIYSGMRKLATVCNKSRSAEIWRPLPAERSFTMAARGGACLFELGLREQRTYLSRLFVLLNGSDEDAEDICEDHELRSHLLDQVSIAHLKQYQTAKALRSKESLVCLESQATILQESTQGVEHSHAGVKRAQRCRDQTHTERTAIASAMRILQGERHDVVKVIPRRWRSGDGASEPVARKAKAKAESGKH